MNDDEKSGRRVSPTDQLSDDDEESRQDEEVTNQIPKSTQFIWVFICVGFVVLLGAMGLFFFFYHQRSHSSPYSITGFYNTSNMVSLSLEYTGTHEYYRNESSPTVKLLNFSFIFVDSSTVRVKIFDASSELWQIPEHDPYPFMANSTSGNFQEDRTVYLNLTGKEFTWKIIRTSTGEILVDSSCGDFIFSELYLETSLCISTNQFAGLGERVSSFWLSEGTYTIWPKEQEYTIDTGKIGMETYGWHPVLYFKEIVSGNFDLLFLRNSNAMDVTLSEDSRIATFKVTGGILDFFFFIGTSDPSFAIESYQEKMLRGWNLIPFWSMGFSQSRWGYKSLDDVKYVVESYSDADLPLDS